MNNYTIKDKVAIITGGAGVLGGSIASCFAEAGAKVVILGRTRQKLEEKLKELNVFGDAIGLECDVLNETRLKEVADTVIEKWGKVDILINVAGGNIPGATLTENQSFFDMKMDDFKKVNELNMEGTVLPCYIFGKFMAENGKGSIINISSMATYSAITRVPGYSVAKTGINIFTQWLAMEMALKYGEGIRVNAVAPGFFIGDQNRKVLINDDGSYTERSKKVLARTPMGRFGDISELNGLVQFLCSDAASFMTGTIIPVDGGFSSFSGV